ncbi:predicted protein [Naegleria gruberi]|uniref:Predicted protein n=1 Tax=Naegleria gruberi TaxID=5762 RepID=D2VPS9_NAEGR|nr:uncharacterized protein NAEGRDRAFT_51300 [Naegleria gruberi]EFC41180.1 predicted protein [Naegleria gruberi]|eukprot:XP_002673924.1 predicted protein [Naegleria gruberi strain NEG-M]
MNTLNLFVLIFALILGMLINKANSSSLKLRALPNVKLQIQEQINKMGNICVLSMSGLDCPGKAQDMNFKTSIIRSASGERLTVDNLPIIAGVGYSRADNSINLPILKSTQATTVSGSQTLTRSINSATDYFNLLHPGDGAEITNTGLYSYGQTATDMIFKKFFQGNLKGYNIQKQFYTHRVEISNIEPTDDFKRIIDLLPENMDQDLYMMVINSFGDSIATKITYGGIVDMTTTVRSCYNDPSMEQYLDIQLQMSINGDTDTKKLPNGYLRYQRVGSLDIIGGNPQLSNINQRTQTFAKNPVPVKMEIIPIWRAFPAGIKQENMKKVYTDYAAAKIRDVKARVAEVEAKRNEDKLRALQFYAFKTDLSNGQIQKFANGNSIYVQAGSVGYFTEEMITLDYYFCVPIGGYPEKCNLIKADVLKPTVHRSSDGSSFYFDFIRGKCDKSNRSNCIFPDNEADSWKVGQTPSSTVSDSCTTVKFDTKSKYFKLSTGSLTICGGCMPMPSSDFKSVTCGCPYLE